MMRSKVSKDSSRGFHMSSEISFLINVQKILLTSDQTIDLTSKNFHFVTKRHLRFFSRGVLYPPAGTRVRNFRASAQRFPFLPTPVNRNLLPCPCSAACPGRLGLAPPLAAPPPTHVPPHTNAPAHRASARRPPLRGTPLRGTPAPPPGARSSVARQHRPPHAATPSAAVGQIRGRDPRLNAQGRPRVAGHLRRRQVSPAERARPHCPCRSLPRRR